MNDNDADGGELARVDWAQIGPTLYLALQAVMDDENLFKLHNDTVAACSDAYIANSTRHVTATCCWRSPMAEFTQSLIGRTV